MDHPMSGVQTLSVWTYASPHAEGGSESQASSVLASGSEDGSVRLWCLARGTLLRVLPQCSGEAVTCLAQAGPDLLLFGDRTGKLSFLDLGSRETTHLLPNILVGEFKSKVDVPLALPFSARLLRLQIYCRPSLFPDKRGDT